MPNKILLEERIWDNGARTRILVRQLAGGSTIFIVCRYSNKLHDWFDTHYAATLRQALETANALAGYNISQIQG